MHLLRRNFLSPAILSLGTLAVFTGMAAADQDFTIDGRPYRLVTNKENFASAEADAISKGGHLVHIDSQAENDAIFSAISAAVPSGSTSSDGGGSVYVWIGGTETAEGNYAWLDNAATPFWTGGKTGGPAAGAYANWGRGTVSSSGPEPDNAGGNQNRAAMAITAWPSSGTAKIGQPGQWNDIRSSNNLAYIIEFDGMWATFSMKHGGVLQPPFTAKLFYDKVPLTVGNFVTLAEGTRPFVDEKNGTVANRPYYNGLKCHRIIKDFMIQGGCPRGDGTSGPGYKFPDEFDSSLRHTVAGMLSMANSGVDTNGSQFFITVVPTTWLDDKHSVFGQVVDGYSTTVDPLSKVPTGTGDRPVQDVVFESVLIHRAGTGARSFAPVLPDPELVPMTATAGTGGACILNFPRTPFAGYDILKTVNLTSWELQEIGSYGEVPDANPLNATQLPPLGAAKRFFRMARVNYPSPGPLSISGKKLVLEDVSYKLTYNLSSATAGTFSFLTKSSGVTQNGAITSWTWTPNSWGGDISATIPAGALTLSGYQVIFLDSTLRPVTNLARSSLFISDHKQYFNNVLRVNRLTMTNLP